MTSNISRTGTLWPAAAAVARARRSLFVATLPLVVIVSFAVAPTVAMAWGTTYVTATLLTIGGLSALLYAGAMIEYVIVVVLEEAGHESVARATPLAADAVLGAVAGSVAARILGSDAYSTVALGAGFLPLYTTIVSKLVLGELGESLGRLLFFPTGMPLRPDYSRAAALAARGNIEAASVEYLRLSEAAPADPEPVLQLARMLRDARRYEDAALWFRSLRRMPLDSALDAQVGRELAELLLYRTGEPIRAAPVLAHLAATHAGTPAGDWAAAALHDVKQTISAP